MKQTLHFFLAFLLIGSCSILGHAQTGKQSDTKLSEDTTDVTIIPLIPVITLSETDVNGAQDEGVFGLLSASKDVFVRITDFNLSAARFRLRGYDSDNTAIYFNGIPSNDLENGWAGWSSWGGLNDMVRRQETNTTLESTGYTFGGIGGAINIDSRASVQRKQTRLTLTRSNSGSYNNRAMLSYATGMQDNGWAFAATISRRWAQEGYIPGTTYDGYSYFLAADKQITKKDIVSVQFLGAPNKRGKANASVQEMYDIAGTNYYNSNWGFQNGEKRNSRVATRHQPMAVLRWDHEFNDKVSLTTAANYQSGRNGSTSLDWYNAPDPRPDYYRKLPSFITGESRVDERLALESYLAADEANRQLDWDQFYETNRINIETIENAEGIEGNSVTGLRSRYIVLDRRYDSDVFNFYTNINAVINNKLTISGGLSYRDYVGHNYQLVDDLLGGDYYVDIDDFALRDFGVSENADLAQNDLNNPNNVVYEGDRFGYNYDAKIQKSSAWGQAEYNLGSLDFFGAVEVSNTRFYRTGLFQNGKFPDSSLGDSEKQSFINYGAKGGVSYGIDGRNYLTANILSKNRAPYFRDAFVSPRIRNEVLTNLQNVDIFSAEAAYVHRSPNAKIKFGGFYTTFKNEVEVKRFYLDESNTFGSYILQNVNKQHLGLEAAFEVNAPFISGLTFQGAASLGQYIYTSRPSALIILDNSAEVVDDNRTVYLKNFYVSGTPQTTGTLGLEYRTSNYLTFNVNVNYFDNIWIEANPNRRTTEALTGETVLDPDTGEETFSNFQNNIERGSDLWNSIIDQQKAPSEFTLDVSVRKSFKLKSGDFISVNIGVDNLLNNVTFINGGYEQLRFDLDELVENDVDRFPPRYYYARGINYFINVAFSFK